MTAAQAPPLVTRKFVVPGLSDVHVPRPRLHQLLVQAFDRYRIVAVTATAGAGKTTAVIEAVAMAGRPVAWLSVDHPDTSPGRLLTYLSAAVAHLAPQVPELVQRAMATGIPHPEVAGILAEAIPDDRSVVVLDDVERLKDAVGPWSVIDAFARYLPGTLVLVGRTVITGDLLDLPGRPVVTAVGDPDLAFTQTEAAEVLRRLNGPSCDPASVVAATGGWVAGVVFGSQLPTASVSDPLHGFLAEQVLGRASAEVQDLLITTAVLDSVDAQRAHALGVEDAAYRIDMLRKVHLPGVWDAGQRIFTPHPRFREFLLDRLQRRPAAEVARLHAAHARALMDAGDCEAAVEEFLAAGCDADALDAARHAVGAVVDRADLDVAQRWLDALQPHESVCQPSELTVARLGIAVMTDDYRLGAELADELVAAGTRAGLAAQSDRAATLMAWSYAQVGRLDDVVDVIESAASTPALHSIEYGVALMSSQRAVACSPPLSGGPVDAFVYECDYFRGRLTAFHAQGSSRWVQTVVGPYRIAALRARGHTQAALDAYRAHRSRLGRLQLQTFIGPEVLIDAGELDEARETLEIGAAASARAGAAFNEMLTLVVRAKLAARYEHDPEVALAHLATFDARPTVQHSWCARELAGVWRGLALLKLGRDEEAARSLRRTVSAMRAAGGLLELPTAAVYLGEAEWRLGNEAAADQSADIAEAAANEQGSNHLLLQALSDFPGVASRRMDVEPGRDTAWHELGQSLSINRPGAAAAYDSDAVIFTDMGPPAVSFGGRTVRPRMTKAYELLAFLLVQPERSAPRDRIVAALFDGHVDQVARTHLRQVLRWLRVLLPGDDPLVTDRHTVAIAPQLVIQCDSRRIEQLLGEAPRHRERVRTATLLEALALHRRGGFLPEVDSSWVLERRRILDSAALDAQFTLASHLYRVGDLVEAGRHVEAALRVEPFRESAWRLRMRIARELGDLDAVLAAFRACEKALNEIGLAASPITRRLLIDLNS